MSKWENNLLHKKSAFSLRTSTRSSTPLDGQRVGNLGEVGHSFGIDEHLG